MADEQSKIDAQIKKEEEERQIEERKQEQEYIKLIPYFKNLSLKFLKIAFFSAVLLLILILIIKYVDSDFFSGPQQFFLFISLIAFCISIALHWHYQILLKDTLSEFSEGISVLAKNKDLNKRIARNRKTVYNNNAPFWIGFFSLLLIVLIWLFSPLRNNDNCKQPSAQTKKANGKITIDLLQINDVYEISPLDSDRIGGMARIATLKKQYLNRNENTLLIMGGDFISPSVFNSVKQGDEKVAGKQMIAAMNAAGVDLTIFGNHEFDVSFSALQQRINESSFQWIASNVYHTSSTGRSLFQKNGVDIPQTLIKTFYNNEGIAFNIGFLGLTTPDNKGNPPYADYDNTLTTAKKMYDSLASECDVVIAITHQDMKYDSLLAVALPNLTAIIGGHEHNMQFAIIGNVYITKANANAKTAFHLKLLLNKANNPMVVITPTLIPVSSAIQQDTLTKIICDRWMRDAMKFFTDSGFSVDRIICKSFDTSLDGTDASVRTGTTMLTRIIADAMLKATKNSGCVIAIYNAGSIRVDDIINPPLTEYAILRALPYGGAVRVADIKGSLIRKMIITNDSLKNDGSFLQFTDNVSLNSLTINGKPIVDTVVYKVAIANYLVNDNASKLNTIYKDSVSIIKVYDPPLPKDNNLYDVRKAVINYLKCNKK